MTKDDIIAMAKEAGFTIATSAYPYEVVPIASRDQLSRFASLVAAKEREACALLCEGWAEGDDCAAAIREGGE